MLNMIQKNKYGLSIWSLTCNLPSPDMIIEVGLGLLDSLVIPDVLGASGDRLLEAGEKVPSADRVGVVPLLDFCQKLAQTRVA